MYCWFDSMKQGGGHCDCVRKQDYKSPYYMISRCSLRTVFGYPPTADVQCILSRNNQTPITIRFSLSKQTLFNQMQRTMREAYIRCSKQVQPSSRTWHGNCIFLYSDAFILLPAHFCAAFSAFVPEARSRTCTRSQVSLGLVLPRASSRFGY